jgi:hypothetical protein
MTDKFRRAPITVKNGLIGPMSTATDVMRDKTH